MCVDPALGVDCSCNVAALVKNVVNAESYDERCAFKEILRNSGIPYKFVGVHVFVGVSAAALHSYV